MANAGGTGEYKTDSFASRSKPVYVLAYLGYRNVTAAFLPVTTMPGYLYERYERYETRATMKP